MVSVLLFNAANDLWAKKWRTEIIWILKGSPKRFSEIKRVLPGCSVKMLSEALQDMEDKQLVIRVQYQTIPVKVTYQLCQDMYPLVDSLVVYRKFLAGYFLVNQERFKITSLEEIKTLERIKLTGE
jgi:DNA-binding HxlR family transcriptional regulator